MAHRGELLEQAVNCRVGSLEKTAENDFWYYDVNCRVGSLESQYTLLRF